MGDNLEVRCQRAPWMAGIELVVCRKLQDGRYAAGAPPVMRTLEIGEAVWEPTARLSMHAAQQLIDELWACGLRPSEGSGSAGSLAATERHLKDMQAIAMGLLRKEGVGL